MRGSDSIEPFLGYAGKGLYLLAVTSNRGAQDLEMQLLANGEPVYTKVLEMAARSQGSAAEVGFVVGLTNAAQEVLARVPDVPLLVPGLGAQGRRNQRARWATASRPSADNASDFLQQLRPLLS